MKFLRLAFGCLRVCLLWLTLTLLYLLLMLSIGVLNLAHDIVFFVWQLVTKLRTCLCDIRGAVNVHIKF